MTGSNTPGPEPTVLGAWVSSQVPLDFDPVRVDLLHGAKESS